MELNYKKYGSSGSAVIIIHGLLGSLDNWQTVAKKISENHIVYVLDQRNHGRSPHSDEIGYQLLSNDIVWFCTQHAIRQCIVIGHSMGGKVAMLFALQNPGLVSQLVVVDIAPVEYGPGGIEILHAMQHAPVSTATTREEVEASLLPVMPDFSVRQFIMKNLLRDKEHFTWKCNVDALAKNYAEITGFPETENRYTGPVVFIKGERSDYISSDEWKVCKQYFPAAELVTIPAAGHWVHAENFEDFMNTLKTVIK